MEHYTMNLKLKVWRQKNQKEKGHFDFYDVKAYFFRNVVP